MANAQRIGFWMAILVARYFGAILMGRLADKFDSLLLVRDTGIRCTR